MSSISATPALDRQGRAASLLEHHRRPGGDGVQIRYFGSVFGYLWYVPFRDMSPIWEVAAQILFWGTPIIYVIESAPNGIRELLTMNPVAAIIEQARHAVIDPSAPSAAAPAGGAVRLLIAIAITGLVLGLALALYRRSAPTIAERL